MTRSELLTHLSQPPAKDPLPAIHEALEHSGRSIIVLDEDPSGAQGVFDVPVLTHLDAQSIRAAIDQAPPLLFILTNSRTLTTTQTVQLHQDLGNILKEYGDEIIIISRSNSSLNERFPLETETLKTALDIPEAPTLFIPFLETRQQLTLHDTHYFLEGGGEGELTHSYLPDALRKNSQQKIPIHSISLEELRSRDLSEKLDALPPSSICIVNALSLHDLTPVSLALHQSKRRFIIRSASTFVQSLAGIASRPTLSPWQMQDLEPNPNGGLIIISPDRPQNCPQLNHLLKHAPRLSALKLSIPDILNSTFKLSETVKSVQEALSSGQNLILFTSHTSNDKPDKRTIDKKISDVFTSLIRELTLRPSFIITANSPASSDIATNGLGIKTAQVLGQILPGIPIWTIGNETPHPGLACLIFPSEVPDSTALTEAYLKLDS